MFNTTHSVNGSHFWRNLTLISIFFLFTPIVIFTSIFTLLSLPTSIKAEDFEDTAPKANVINAPKSGVRVYASLPSDTPSITGEVETADGRVEVIRKYLRYYYSPLEPYANILVSEADKNNLDYKLLTAIAQQESNLCKKMPAGTYNCWGWGIHSEGTLAFDNYEEGIGIVSDGLKRDYIQDGLTSVEEIMGKYTPLSNGSWADGVNKFMEDIENMDY
jgi:hypothetical protein